MVHCTLAKMTKNPKRLATFETREVREELDALFVTEIPFIISQLQQRFSETS